MSEERKPARITARAKPKTVRWVKTSAHIWKAKSGDAQLRVCCFGDMFEARVFLDDPWVMFLRTEPTLAQAKACAIELASLVAKYALKEKR